MKIYSTLSRHATLAMLIAATGLPASIASAQFKVEYDDKDPKPAQAQPASALPATVAPKSKSRSQSVFVVTSDDDEHTYKVRVVNGEVQIAQVDGKDIDHDRVKVDGDAVIFLSEDGKTLHEFRVPGAPALPAVPAPPGGGVVHLEVKPGFTWSSNNRHGEGNLEVRVAALTQPKVMLGINLSEPSPALRKQLRLGEQQQVILVDRVIKGLPADKAGLEDFDVIVSIDDSDQASGEILRDKLAEKEAGDTLKLVLLRGGEKQEIKVKLAAYDAKALGNDESDDDIAFFDAPDAPDSPLTNDFHQFPDLKDQSQRLHEQLMDQQQRQQREQELAMRMQQKAMEAMQDVQRQMLEFKDGKLILRSRDDLSKSADRLQRRFMDAMPDQEVMEQHMNELETRLADLETRLNQQLDQMGEHMDRLSNMFERLMERLEEDKD